jgi:hypothetical protein
MSKKTDEKKTVRIPKKTGINLAMREKKTGSLLMLGIGIGVTVIVCALIAKFGVIDQYNRLAAAESSYNTIHMQYMATLSEASTYDAVTAEYRKYSRDWMINDDSGRFVSVDRTDVLDLVEKDLMGKGIVNKISIYGDRAVIDMSGMTLKEISAMFAVVEQEPIVGSAVLNIAQTEAEQQTASILDFSITITLQKAEEAAQ